MTGETMIPRTALDTSPGAAFGSPGHSSGAWSTGPSGLTALRLEIVQSGDVAEHELGAIGEAGTFKPNPSTSPGTGRWGAGGGGSKHSRV